jgi:hypothetical protein
MAWKMSQKLKVTPAELYHVGDDLVGPYLLGKDIARFCFNRSVWYFGASLEMELESVQSNAKDAKVRQMYEEQQRTRILDAWIPKASDAETPKAKPATKFRDPAKR